MSTASTIFTPYPLANKLKEGGNCSTTPSEPQGPLRPSECVKQRKKYKSETTGFWFESLTFYL